MHSSMGKTWSEIQEDLAVSGAKSKSWMDRMFRLCNVPGLFLAAGVPLMVRLPEMALTIPPVSPDESAELSRRS